jgi:glycine cleavage system H protein
MSTIPQELRYTAEHEWVRLSEDGQTAIVGITDYAQSSLGDVTFVELPAVGSSFGAHDTFGVVESVKAASDLYMPVAGEILEVNSNLESAPDLVNTDPYGEAWMIKIRLENPSDYQQLLSAAEYQAKI